MTGIRAISQPTQRRRPAVAATLTLWLRNLATRRALAELPPHLLDDVGLSPAAARREAARPFWR